LIAFKLTKIAPMAVFIGVGLIFFSKKRTLKRVGEILTGFGILFMGMDIMSAAMKPLRGDPNFVNLMVKFENPIIGVLIGCLVTAIVQSSSASIAILQALAMQGLIGLPGAIYILFGQNIGTCVTALLASIGTSVTAKRAAMIHFLFNVVGTTVFMIAIFLGLPFVPMIEVLTPGNAARQIANAHTIFNVINTLFTLPFVGYLVFLSKKVLPGKEEGFEEKRLIYLDKRILETPPIAVAQILKEVGRMAELARQNVEAAMRALFHRDEEAIQEVYRREGIINFLNREITQYLVLVNGLKLRGEDLELIGGLFHVVNDAERVGDHAENLIEYAEHAIENKLVFSDMAIKDLEEMTAKVLKILDDSIQTIKTRDKNLAMTIEPQEQHIDELQETLRNAHIARLNAHECIPSTGVIFLDIVTNLERIADHACNIGYSVISTEKMLT
jgi:phosphate:Na+ symporter